MGRILATEIAIVGAGAGGLTIAATAAQLGIKVILIEANKMGGDCLNYGCVPSKSLLAAARTAHICRHTQVFGITPHEPAVDFAQVMAYVQSVINKLSAHDSVERFVSLGVEVIHGNAKFNDENTLQVEDNIIKARHFVLATGSVPLIPPITGLAAVPYLTNEAIFSLQHKPTHLMIIGGGPVGCEMAQAFAMLGVNVTLLEAKTIMPHDEPELVAQLKQQLLATGVALHEQVNILQVNQFQDQIQLMYESNGQSNSIIGSHVFVATGRQPNLAALNLTAARIDCTRKGIIVNRQLRTTNRRVYAIGDVTGGYQFTHVANYHASIVIKNLLFRLPAKVNYASLSWVTYTLPELAHVGLTEQQARQQYSKIKVIVCPFSANDRAQTEAETNGTIKVITNHKGYILGASILGANAGELIGLWIFLIKHKKKIRALTDIIIPYPTLNEMSKLAANMLYKDLLFSPRIKQLVKLLKFRL